MLPEYDWIIIRRHYIVKAMKRGYSTKCKITCRKVHVPVYYSEGSGSSHFMFSRSALTQDWLSLSITNVAALKPFCK
jgi:hypothetical protein